MINDRVIVDVQPGVRKTHSCRVTVSEETAGSPATVAVLQIRHRCSLLPAGKQLVLSSILLVLLLSQLLLSACSTPGPAPVVSREKRPVAAVKTKPGFYQVRKGDTLYSVAWQAQLDYRILAAWNGIRPPYTIHPRQLLRLFPLQQVRSVRSRPTHPPVASKPAANKAAPPVNPRPVHKKTTKAAAPRKLEWLWPTNGEVVQSFSSQDRSRQGIKIAGLSGQIIRATEGGKVLYSGSGLIGYGKLIIIEHKNNYLSAYGHNRKILVREGDNVTRGQSIGEMGTPAAAGPRLHFEIRRNGTPINPLQMLPRQR